MVKINRFISSLRFIFIPSYWIMNDQYSEGWDKIFNKMLDKYEFTEIKKHTAKLGNVEIWISNRPYSCMMPYEEKGKQSSFRPSRLTIFKAIKKLNKAINHNVYEKYSSIQ